MVIYIDSNEDNEDEGENNFHGYDKDMGICRNNIYISPGDLT